VAVVLLSSIAWSADLGSDLLTAARKGQVQRVRELLDQGAPVDVKDKQGRSAQVLAAENEQPAVVALLLARSGRPAPLRVALDAAMAPGNLYSSCFMNPSQLAQHVAGLQPDAMVSAALRDYAVANGKGVLEFGGDENIDTVLQIRVRPGASCEPQRSVDSLTLAIDVKLLRKGRAEPLWEKTIGGGLKGLHARAVSSPAQYAPLFEEWAKQHTSQMYWNVLAALVR
jgi:hypothetical protein